MEILAMMKLFLLCFVFCILAAAPLLALQTKITVRILSKDAKFIGTSMGGVSVTIKDVDTGKILAEGVVSGATGDTARIMKTPKTRGMDLSDDKSGKFEATIDIDVPKLIEVSAYGPLSQRQSANRISQTMWVIPGKHISNGDGWMMEMPGFVVDILTPPAHIKFTNSPQEIKFHANVTMMCGCPIEPNGLWDANKYEVKAVIKKEGEIFTEIPMVYAGKASQFAGTFKAEAKGTYLAYVYAYDAANGNTGIDNVTFIIE